MDVNGAIRTTYLNSDNIVGYEDSYVQNPVKHPMEDLSALIRARGLERATIGLEMDNYYFTASAFVTLQRELPNVRLDDATGLVNWQRAVKSPTEIDYIRRAARIVERMHGIIRERVAPGICKHDLIADIYHASICGADGHWGDYPAMVPMAPSGVDATAPHLTWDDRPMRVDENTFFEIAGAYRRYHCPQSRTVYLGKPPQKFYDAEKAVVEAIEAGFDWSRHIVLMRHPLPMCESLIRSGESERKAAAIYSSIAANMAKAARRTDTLSVRFEDMIADPGDRL
jgi:ectoine hydrolase